MKREELATIIRDWFLSCDAHYAGWSEYEADVDGTFDFLKLADHILDQGKGPATLKD